MATPSFTNKLVNKKVLIIGGSAGVGFSVAQGVLEFGGIAIVSSSSSSRVSSAVSSLQSRVPSAGSRVSGATLDLASTVDIDARINTLLQSAKDATNGETIDHIVFTAGDSVPISPVKEATPEMIQRLLAVRVQGAILTAKHAAAYMTPSPYSSFTLTTGNSKDRPPAGWALVAGLIGSSQEGLARGLAVELQPIRANLISLGLTETEILDKIGLTAEIKEKMRLATLTKRIASPEDVAEAYLYVMRDPNVTGQTISTEGGSSLA